MKTIIIPADFTTNSLSIAEAAVRSSDEKCRLVFIHMFRLPSDIQDLLFSTYRKKESELIGADFREGCQELKAMFEYRVHDIQMEFIYGNTLSLLKSHLDAYQTSQIAYSEELGVQALSKTSVDIPSILHKTGYELLNVDALLETNEYFTNSESHSYENAEKSS
ncbi:hypothetical protein GCM10027275_16930 [Rhabdobacter roseus]|uniref:Universal stress protein n=1 Tax=Rhabdobacter roseus TaxID=1655419 RepID=A0A840TPF1_9BACT|nr:hypothetical protein [Rhabdobacter roseus]MBB5283617.1 hypothetical protein [Rhabdobacter roseus]